MTKRNYIVTSAFNSAHCEGNKNSIENFYKIYDELVDGTPSGLPDVKDHNYNEKFIKLVDFQEMKNSVSNYLWAYSLELSDDWLTIPFIEEIQSHVVHNMDFTMKYDRNKLTRESQSMMFAPQNIGHTRTWLYEHNYPSDVYLVDGVSAQKMWDAKQVNETIQWAIDDYKNSIKNAKTDNERLLAIFTFHSRFELCHPFGDGNGRTGRIIMDLMLKQIGYSAFTQNDLDIHGAGRDKYITMMNKLKSRTNGFSYNSLHKRNPWLVGKFTNGKTKNIVINYLNSMVHKLDK